MLLLESVLVSLVVGALSLEQDNCELYFRRCLAGQCIPLSKICDGAYDCPRGEDEIDCQNRDLPTKNLLPLYAGNMRPNQIGPELSPVSFIREVFVGPPEQNYAASPTRIEITPVFTFSDPRRSNFIPVSSVDTPSLVTKFFSPYHSLTPTDLKIFAEYSPFLSRPRISTDSNLDQIPSLNSDELKAGERKNLFPGVGLMPSKSERQEEETREVVVPTPLVTDQTVQPVQESIPTQIDGVQRYKRFLRFDMEDANNDATPDNRGVTQDETGGRFGRQIVVDSPCKSRVYGFCTEVEEEENSRDHRTEKRSLKKKRTHQKKEVETERVHEKKEQESSANKNNDIHLRCKNETKKVKTPTKRTTTTTTSTTTTESPKSESSQENSMESGQVMSQRIPLDSSQWRSQESSEETYHWVQHESNESGGASSGSIDANNDATVEETHSAQEESIEVISIILNFIDNLLNPQNTVVL